MSKSLIIVESPAKIKTLKKFLGGSFVLESSVGHVRDLPEKEFGIDLQNDFEPTYVVLPNKKEVISKLRKAAKSCDTIYLSPDPDREGEAIAWHIAQILPPNANIKRVSFNSITKEAVLKALKEPRTIDMALVNAQQARRLLDRIVGYKISPILNRRIQRGRDGSVSAGRVQSVALKLVVDREKEIAAFKPTEYWNISAILKTDSKDEKPFQTNLYSVDGKKVEKERVEGKDFYLIPTKESAEQILERLKEGPYTVTEVERKEKRRFAPPPFITSTLQQEASRHYGFSAARTMSTAQSLYEGIDLGNEGAEGLITYMRTDSVRIVPEAIEEARKLISSNYGPDFLPPQPKIFSTSKSAQDAHEAIRPTNLNHPPEKIEAFLTREQFLLYQLVWRRFIASQMMPAVYDTISADIAADKGIVMRATGSLIKFQGFLVLYEEKIDDEEKGDEGRILPNLQEGQELTLVDLAAEQAFTRPPPRYTEASLVKELEKSGIGRPSTYAPIMNKIQSREYTYKESNRLHPTELGFVVAELLENNFKEIMDVTFTAQMEDALELIAESRLDWKRLIQEFWKNFEPTLSEAEKSAFVPKIMTDINCPQCGSKLQKIWSKSKYFYGCSNYPECRFTAPLEELEFKKEDYADDFNWEQKCPKCGSDMKVRHGRYGPFLGCTSYPDCKGIVNIPKKGELTQENLPSCPAIGCPGQMRARKSRFGKTFYSCSTYPECDVIVNDIADLESKYSHHERTPYVKKSFTKAGKKPASPKAKAKPKAKAEKKGRTQSAVPLSPELAAIVGADSMARTEVTKKLWDYIKSKNLQDPKDKRKIVPDAKLAKVLGKEPISMFKLSGALNKHFK